MEQGLDSELKVAEIEKIRAEASRAKRSLFAEPAFWAAAAALAVAIVGYIEAMYLDARAAERDTTKAELQDAKSDLNNTKIELSTFQANVDAAKNELESKKSEILESKKDLRALEVEKETAQGVIKLLEQNISLNEKRLSFEQDRVRDLKECISETQNFLAGMENNLDETMRGLFVTTLNDENEYIEQNFLGKPLEKHDIGALFGFVSAKQVVPYFRSQLRTSTKGCDFYSSIH